MLEGVGWKAFLRGHPWSTAAALGWGSASLQESLFKEWDSFFRVFSYNVEDPTKVNMLVCLHVYEFGCVSLCGVHTCVHVCAA